MICFCSQIPDAKLIFFVSELVDALATVGLILNASTTEAQPPTHSYGAVLWL